MQDSNTSYYFVKNDSTIVDTQHKCNYFVDHRNLAIILRLVPQLIRINFHFSPSSTILCDL